MAKVRFRKFRRGETTANVFALPAVKELTERATSRYCDYFAPIKYKGDLDELTRRVKLIARGTYRTKYTSEKFHEKLSPGAAAKRRKEGTLGYTSQAAARQAEKTSLGRKINAALRKPERARLETHKERAKNPGRFTGSPRVSPRRGVAACCARLCLKVKSSRTETGTSCATIFTRLTLGNCTT